MPISIYTGNPREGKTLFAVNQLNDLAKQGGRPLFSNITGLKIPGVQPAPVDWNELPDGAIAFYDEAQEIQHPDKLNRDGSPHLMYAATAKAGFETDPWLKNLSTHGKRGIDLYFITQHPTLIHHQIRKYCDEHKHFVRTMGLERATIYTWWKKCVTSVDDHLSKHSAEKSIWKYPKDTYKLYESALIHNIKVKIPKKAIFAVLIGLATVSGIAWWISSNFGGADETEKTQTGTQTGTQTESGFNLLGGSAPENPSGFKNPVATALHESVKPNRSVSGCVSGRFCRCFDQEGMLIDFTETMCRDLAEGNLALPIKIDSGGGGQPPGQTL